MSFNHVFCREVNLLQDEKGDCFTFETIFALLRSVESKSIMISDLPVLGVPVE